MEVAEQVKDLELKCVELTIALLKETIARTEAELNAMQLTLTLIQIEFPQKQHFLQMKLAELKAITPPKEPTHGSTGN